MSVIIPKSSRVRVVKEIAKGSGTSLQEVNKLLKQFEDTRKVMKMATSMKNPMKMMRQMK